jgi:hypothetical protein
VADVEDVESAEGDHSLTHHGNSSSAPGAPAQLYVFDGSGNLVSGFPKDLPGSSANDKYPGRPALADVDHRVLAQAEDILVLRPRDGQALVEVQLRHVQAVGRIGLGEHRHHLAEAPFVGVAEGGQRGDRQGAHHHRRVGRRDLLWGQPHLAGAGHRALQAFGLGHLAQTRCRRQALGERQAGLAAGHLGLRPRLVLHVVGGLLHRLAEGEQSPAVVAFASPAQSPETVAERRSSAT